jgi:multiple sugar transport system substrate-binding protein
VSHITRRRFLLMLPTLASGGCMRSRGSGSSRDADGRTVIRFWNGFTGPDGKTMEAIVQQFMAENPDVRVRMQIIPWGTYYDKVTLALAYGGAPEVFILHATRMPEFASYDALHALDDLYAAETAGGASPLAESNFAPIPWHASFFGGHQYALPLDVHPIGLYYNTRLFEEAGIVDAAGKAKPPTDWTGFIDAAHRLTRDTDGDGRVDQWGFNFTWQRTNFVTFLAQHGGSILTPDGKQGALSSSESVRAADVMRDLIDRYRVAPRPEGVDAWLAFRQGKVGMVMEGIYMLSSLEEQKGLAFAGAPVPRFGPKPGAWAGSHLLCQPRGIAPDVSRAAWRLMRYISDHSLDWARGGQVPARRDIRESAAFQALPVQSQFARQLPYVQYEPLHPKANAIGPFIDPAIEASLLDLQTPEAAFADADRRMNQVLARP